MNIEGWSIFQTIAGPDGQAKHRLAEGHQLHSLSSVREDRDWNAQAAPLEEGENSVQDAVVVINDWYQAPFVEGGAWMGDTAANQVADVQIFVCAHLHIGVLGV